MRTLIKGLDGLDGAVVFGFHDSILLRSAFKRSCAEDLRQGYRRGAEVVEAEVEADALQGVRGTERLFHVLLGHGVGQQTETVVLQKHFDKAADHIRLIEPLEHILIIRAHGGVAFFERHVQKSPCIVNGDT